MHMLQSSLYQIWSFWDAKFSTSPSNMPVPLGAAGSLPAVSTPPLPLQSTYRLPSSGKEREKSWDAERKWCVRGPRSLSGQQGSGEEGQLCSGMVQGNHAQSEYTQNPLPIPYCIVLLFSYFQSLFSPRKHGKNLNAVFFFNLIIAYTRCPVIICLSVPTNSLIAQQTRL